jgi:hypothetical protein
LVAYSAAGTGAFKAWAAPDDQGRVGPPPNDYCSYAGVFGTGVYVTGVAGTSINKVGVYGQNGMDPESKIPGFASTIGAGVFGASHVGWGLVGWSTKGKGIYGVSPELYGVEGQSNSTSGVRGVSNAGPGVEGYAAYGNGVKGHSGGLPGPTIPDPVKIAGVLGTCNTQHGVIGASNANVGVYGYSSNSVGIFGTTSNPASYAGVFAGNVSVVGTLLASVKNGVVPFPDGSQRLLHCMESPEHWFEDFSSAKLRRGRAVVKLDANFAKVIKRGDYRVFVTPEGDCHGLYVCRKSANNFEVRELTGGKSNVAFSYRIVGRRKDIKRHRRFAKVDMPVPLPAKPPRVPRRPVPTAADLRAFVAQVEKEARESMPKGAEKVRARMRSNRGRPPLVPPRELLAVGRDSAQTRAIRAGLRARSR